MDKGLWIVSELGLDRWIQFRYLEMQRGFLGRVRASSHTSLGLGLSHYPTIKFALRAESDLHF